MVVLHKLYSFLYTILFEFAFFFSWLWDQPFGVLVLSYLSTLIPFALFFLIRGAAQGKKLKDKSVLIPLIFLSIMTFMFALSALFARFV